MRKTNVNGPGFPRHPVASQLRKSEVFMETNKSQQRLTEEFKTKAVRHVTERGHPIAEVVARLTRQAG